MTTILGLAGSLRSASFNGVLLRAAAHLAPAGSTLEIASIRGIPLYDGDVEARDGVPDVVSALKDRIAAADGLLLATPEYNNSVPGVLKNAIDWLTRPPTDVARVFHGLPVALMGASTGPNGTLLAQAAWLAVLRPLRTVPWFGTRITVARAAKAFDDSGHLVDEAARAQLQEFVHGFVAFSARHGRSSA